MSDYYGDIIIPAQLATASDYTGFVGTASAPATIDLTLQACTTLVIDACEGAFYDTDPATGVATDAIIAAAMRKATLLQAAAWVTLGIDPLAGGVAQLGEATTQKIGSATLVYDATEAATAAAARAAAAVGLVPAALRVLQQVNLLGTNPWYYG